MVISVNGRILTHRLMGECHFHDTPLALHLITGGKGGIQTMLAQVNGNYHLAPDAVSKREMPTENWPFRATALMDCVK